MHRSAWFSFSVSVMVLSFSTACGSDDDSAEPGLPPAETMALPDPSDGASASTQALCTSDTYAYDVLHAFIEAHNEEISAAIDLVRAVVEAQQEKLEKTGQVQYTVSGAQRTLSFIATTESDADASVSYQATFTGPNVASYVLLTGTANADRSAGTWTILKVDGTTAVTVVWSIEANGDIHADRTVAGSNRTASYDRIGTDATVIFAGTDNNASATWDTATGAGSVTVNGEQELCFTRTNNDFCTEECD